MWQKIKTDMNLKIWILRREKGYLKFWVVVLLETLYFRWLGKVRRFGLNSQLDKKKGIDNTRVNGHGKGEDG